MNVKTRTIDLPVSYEFAARGMQQSVDIASLSVTVLVQAALHGLKQTISDAASNAAGSAYDGARTEAQPLWKDLDAKARKGWATDNATLVEQEASALMDKRIAALAEGDWTTRTPAAAGMTLFEQYCAEMVAAQLTFPTGTKKPEKLRAGLEKYEAQPRATRDAIGELVKARIERERAESAIKIDLSL